MIHYKNLLTIELKAELAKNSGKTSVKSPREHQVKAQREMSQFYFEDQKKAGILVLPTGGGKTYTAVYWLLKNVISKNFKVLWLADQGLLLEQARESFRENILETDVKRREQITIRLVSGSDRHGNPNEIAVSDDILLITAQTAISNWEDNAQTRFKKFVDENGKEGTLFIVYDEAHHTPAFGRRNLLIGGSEDCIGIMEKFPRTQLLGLTATPTYTDRKQRGWLWEIFKDGIIHEVSKKVLEDRKVLANPVFIQQKTNFKPVLSDSDMNKMVLKHQEIPSHIVEELAQNEERNDFIARHYCDNREKYGKTLIFLDRWYQCRTIEKYINRIAGKELAASVFSSVDTTKDVDYINNRTADQNDVNLQKFKTGELEVLINVRMLTEGVDVPDVKTVFITRDTNSSILFTQMIGRALRGEMAGGNKSTANIVMFTDDWNRHIHFASNRMLGGKESLGTKERGLRPLELIRIDLLDRLELEYQKQDYEKSIFDLMPIGWYVVKYMDTIEEDNEDGEAQKVTESFSENVTVLEHEESLFKDFVNEYPAKHRNILWEKEELDYENAERIMTDYLISKTQPADNAIISKLIKIARHVGQNDNKPDYFTFSQKSEVDIMKHVKRVRENNWGRDETEEYLELEYHRAENPFLKVIFATYEDFYRAYEYEDNVYRRAKKGGVSISESNQAVTVQRLAGDEVRRIVYSRDGHKCQCCGKSTNLQVDHIISFKEQQPENDSPDLYQTLCGTCNREKSSNSHNYRITRYDLSKLSVENVLTNPNEDPKYYFARLINCFFKTSAVHIDSIHASNHGRSVWKASIKYGVDAEETIMKHKAQLLSIMQSKGFRLKELEILVK